MSHTPRVTAEISSTPYLVTLRNDRGHEWQADEPVGSGGGERAPTPHELLLSALGACTAMTLRMYALRKGWPLSQVRVELAFNPDGPPPGGGSDIRRDITLGGEFSAAQRERLLQIANACPLHKVLTGEVRIATSFTGTAAAS